MEFSVCAKETHGYFESYRIWNKYIHCLVRWPINKLVDNTGDMLRLKENIKDPPKEMVIWDVIEDKSPLNKWDGDPYNEKQIESNDMNVTRQFKRIK
jgi:hypothetical protein